MTITSQHFIETQVFLNVFLSDIFMKLDVENQTPLICG